MNSFPTFPARNGSCLWLYWCLWPYWLFGSTIYPSLSSLSGLGFFGVVFSIGTRELTLPVALVS